MADKAAIYYPGLTGLAQRPRGGKPPNWNFVAPAKGGGGVLKTPTPLTSCLLACIAACYLPVCIIIINLGPINCHSAKKRGGPVKTPPQAPTAYPPIYPGV